MSGQDVLKEALKLMPDEQFILVEGLIESLDNPDRSLGKVWVEEAEKRLEAYRAGCLKAVPVDEVFKGWRHI